MAWDYRSTLKTILYKLGVMLLLGAYGIVALLVIGRTESYFPTGELRFNLLKFALGAILTLGAGLIFYLLPGTQVFQWESGRKWNGILFVLSFISLTIGFFSLTYWSQFMEYEYYSWTHLGIYGMLMIITGQRIFSDTDSVGSASNTP